MFAEHCLDVRFGMVDVVAGDRFHRVDVPGVYRVDVQIENEYTIPAEQVRQEHEKWLALIRETQPVDRDDEFSPTNLGYRQDRAGRLRWKT